MNLSELKALKRGQWIFTCSLEPKQFDSFEPEKDPKRFDRSKFSDESWELFSKYDDFTTTEGSLHSVQHCSCKVISQKYAKWFIENKIWELFPPYGLEDSFQVYEKLVKEKCEKDNIEYEGI